MANPTFKEMLDNDVKEIFLNGEYSQEAIYQSGDTVKTITLQLFEEPLDKMSTTFHHAWCSFSDIPRVVVKKDLLTIGDVVYGIMDASPDEFESGMNLFLQKVESYG